MSTMIVPSRRAMSRRPHAERPPEVPPQAIPVCRIRSVQSKEAAPRNREPPRPTRNDRDEFDQKVKEPLYLTADKAGRDASAPGKSSIVVVFFLVLVLEDPLLGELDTLAEIRGLARLEHDFLFLDQPLLPQVEEAVVEEHHAVFAAGLDRGIDPVRLVFADQVRDRRRYHEHLVGGDQPLGLARQERLGEDPDDRDGELGANLVLLLLREDVD